MAEVTKDFIKFVAEVIALLIIFSVVFSPEGIATSTFNYFLFAEPIMLQNYLSTALTAGSQTGGEFSSSIKITSGLPHTIKTFYKDGIPYVNVIPAEGAFLRTKFKPLEPSPIITTCIVKELEVKLESKLAQTVTVKKTFEDDKCFLEFIVGIGESSIASTLSCIDGTLSGQCSETRPKYCDENGELIDNCQKCWCSGGTTCQDDGSCQFVEPGSETCDFNCKSQGFDSGLCRSGGCQPEETSIGSDGCSSGLCCCKQMICTYCDSTWTPGACGDWCSSGFRQETRACTPAGCTPSDGLGTSNCVIDSSCSTPAQFQVTINQNKIIGTNSLSPATELDDANTVLFTVTSQQKQLFSDAKIKLVRAIDYRIGMHFDQNGPLNPSWKGVYLPCRNSTGGSYNAWNDVTKNCYKWDWQYVDGLVNNITALGAEPLITLLFISDSGGRISVPSGMPMDTAASDFLPNRNSWAAYAAKWVEHLGSKVRYYEIGNEAWFYFGGDDSGRPWNATKASYFLQLYNLTYYSMKNAASQKGATIFIGNDAALWKGFLTYFVQNWKTKGVRLDFLSAHKYNSWGPPSYCASKGLDPQGCSDEYGIDQCEKRYFSGNNGVTLNASEARSLYGGNVPVMFTETQWSAYCPGGVTDPRNQQIIGATCTALWLKGSMLSGVNYTVYFDWVGAGFGMINSSTNLPRYPYYVMKWVGNNIGIGDKILESISTNGNVSSIAWNHSGKLNILLIHKSTGTKTVSLSGVSGQFNYQKIDDPTGTSYLNPVVQTGTVNAGDVITLNGYTVLLLQTSTQDCTYCDSTWTIGACGGSCGSGYRQYTRTCTPTGCSLCPDGQGISRCVSDSSCGTPAQFQIVINPNIIVSKNNLQVGFQSSFQSGNLLVRTDILSIINETKPKIVRLFDFRTPSDAPNFKDPCIHWDETTKTGTWDWTFIDQVMNMIYSTGAEPLICLGHSTGVSFLPSGMTIKSNGLPDPTQFAAYAREWVRHLKSKGYLVKYYEIWNEPYTYFGWTDATKLANWVAMVKVIETEMHKEDSSILIGNDASTQRKVFDALLSSGINLGFLSYHKYDTGDNSVSDSYLFKTAEEYIIASSGTYYSLKEAQTKWKTATGNTLLLIDSESNMNYAWNPVDPRLKQMSNAVWNAMTLRKEALEGVNYHVYFDEYSLNSSGQLKGFGYVSWATSVKRWYPFYVYMWIGNNLAAGNNIVNSTSTPNIRTMAWINNGNLNIMLIHNSTSTETVSLQGTTGSFAYQKIDDPTGTSYLNAQVQSGTINAGDVITLNKYTVVFLQQTSTTAKSYTVSISGSTISAKNDQTGIIEFSGTNAATVMNSALNALTTGRTQKEKVTLIGTFTINNTIRIPSYTILNMTSAKLNLADSKTANVIDNYDQTNGNSNIEIIGGEINGNRLKQTVKNYCIDLEDVSNFLVKDVYVHDCSYHGIHLINATDGIVDNCTSNSNIFGTEGEDGVFIGRASQKITVKNSNFLNNYVSPGGIGLGGGVEVRGFNDGHPTDIRIENSYFQNNGEGAIILSKYDSSVAYCCKRITISGNTMTGNTGAGVWVYFANDSVISNNQITNTYSTGSGSFGIGVTIDNSSNVSINNNIIRSSNQYGVRLRYPQSIKNKVTNNQIYENNLDGIHVESVSNNDITGNTLRDNKANGVWLMSGSSSNIVVNNVICNNVLSAIKNDGTSNTISPNSLSCVATCDSTCKSQFYASGTCRAGSSLPSPTAFNTIANPRDGIGGKAFHNHTVLINMFKTLYDQYPGYASYEPIGKTYEGRDIVLFKIGNPNGGKVLWDGSMHGWEDVGSEVEYLISKWLLENGTTGIDTTAQKIIQQNLILFVPVVNMDSYERQNRNFTNCYYGIDINRNFVKGWYMPTVLQWNDTCYTQFACSATLKCNRTNYPQLPSDSYYCRNNICTDGLNYPGSSSASEKETQAMRYVFQTYKPSFYLNTHYGGGQYMGSSVSTSVETQLIQSIRQISTQRGVTPYSMSTGSCGLTGSGGSGMAYCDAKQIGVLSSWLIELNDDNHYLSGASRTTSCGCWGHKSTCDTYQDVVNSAYPRMLPIFIAMANASAIITPATCQAGETSIGQDGCSSGNLCCCK